MLPNIDVNAGSFVEQEAEYLCWLVEVVKGSAMINSISLEERRMVGMMPLVKKYKTKIVGLCQSDEGVAATVSDRVKIIGD